MFDWESVFKALADGTRLKMMALLIKHGELCVCDLMEALEIGQSKASRHLRYLLHAGLLEDRREAVWVYYRVSQQLSADIPSLVKILADVLPTDAVKALDKRLAKWSKVKACKPPARNAKPAHTKKVGRLKCHTANHQ